jgi:hypothetical protein
MDRLQKHYLQEAEKLGVDLRIFTRSENNMEAKIGHSQAVVIFTNKISHQARNQAVNSASMREIPVFMSHNCGVCALRDCINCIKKQLDLLGAGKGTRISGVHDDRHRSTAIAR